MFPPGTADEVMAGRLTISPFPTVTIDAKRDGDVDWSLNPYHHPSWTLHYRSAEWVETVVNRYLAGGPGAAAYRDRAKALLRDWLRDVPVQDRNPSTLVCSVAAFPGQSWIENQIPGQVDQYARHWIGAWNHGLMQDLTLLRIGCAYPAQAWGGRPLRWRALARRQMIAAFAPNRLGPAVDAQGVPNEQSTGYANFVYHLWTVAERELSACGYAVPAEMSDRVARMPMFVAQATHPDGNVVQIGDTYAAPPARVPGTPVEYAASMGAAGSPPAQRVAVYAAGYVFGRSGWGITRPLRSESFYSLRFGRGRQVHGHNDHMSVTYYARGRNLIVDSGHVGYEATPYRDFLRSPSANNVLVMPGVPFSATAGTTLIRRAIGPSGQFFEFTDTAFGGHPRDRSIYISQRPDLMVVLDRAGGAPLYQQLWHLDPGLTVTKVQPSYAVAAAPGTRLWIRQVALPGQVIPPGSTRVIRGQANPDQGWVSRQPLQRIPASVISMTRAGPSAAILTVIVPTSAAAAVTTMITSRTDGRYRLEVRIGGSTVLLRVSPGGYIERG